MTEPQKAKAWREKRDLSIDQLAKLTGYGTRALYWMERGQAPPNATRSKPAKISEAVWQRYRMVCAGVEAQLHSRRTFKW